MKRLAAWVVMVLMTSGCVNLTRTSAVRESELRPATLHLVHKHDDRVAIMVKGRGERQVTQQALKVTIADVAEPLHAAIATTIQESRLFSAVVDESRADLLLTVTVLKADAVNPATPKHGGDEVVVLDWTLTRIEGGGLVFNEIIVTGNLFENSYAYERLIRDGLEDALRRNIQRGLVSLSQIRLP